MSEFNAFVSPQYPVLHSVERGSSDEYDSVGRTVSLSLGLLVKGIPSFLATVLIGESEVEAVTGSLLSGNVRVVVVGISIDETDLPEDGRTTVAPWLPAPEEERHFPAAFLSLVCSDGRRIDVVRVVVREGSATPEKVAKFVLSQITQGVQITDLASTP
jgi:hypothetical protein